MIRTTSEAALLGLWRDADVLRGLASTEFLTTARYEPVSRNALGSGHVDVLFEDQERSCVLSARLDPNSLITRERSPFVWPLRLAQSLDARSLIAIESFLTPWLRSIARARPMARESIRRFAASERFDRARSAELLGATPLQKVMRRMAPFVYARRFAAGKRVSIDCADDALGFALLSELASSIGGAAPAAADAANSDRSFARAWYGVPSYALSTDLADLVFTDTRDGRSSETLGSSAAAIVIEPSPSDETTGAMIDVPSPAPLDLLFSFDAADAPVLSRFSIRAPESPLRACAIVDRPDIIGGSSGTIVLALSAEALAMRGADVEEMYALKQWLAGEGFTVSVATDPADRAMASAELVHIFGAAFESHTIAFGQAALERGIDFVFDLPPIPQSPSGLVENLFVLALRAASDDAETSRYLQAYEGGQVTGTTLPEPSAEEFARTEERFGALATKSLAVITTEEDLSELRARLPPLAAARLAQRGIYASPEPPAVPIGHLVPTAPFAFVHATICARSHALIVAHGAESRGIPVVIAGPCYDVDYLQTLRSIAPSAVILADPEAGVLSAIYRRATIWVDAAPRPRSSAALARATASGLLPVLAAESPLTRIAGAGTVTFRATSFEDCAATVIAAMGMPDRDKRVASLHERLAPQRDLTRTFGGLMAAYARVATTV